MFFSSDNDIIIGLRHNNWSKIKRPVEKKKKYFRVKIIEIILLSDEQPRHHHDLGERRLLSVLTI